MYDGMSLEIENVNTSMKYDKESSSSTQEEFQEVNIEENAKRSGGRAIDRYIGGKKNQELPINLKEAKKQHDNFKKLQSNIQEGPMPPPVDPALLAKLKSKSIADSFFYPKVNLKIIGIPNKVANPLLLNIVVNDTGQDIVSIFGKEEVKNGNKVDNVDYSQLESALKGYYINSEDRNALRRSWHKSCDKQAAESCKKACYKSVDNVSGSKHFIKTFRKECKRSCTVLFIGVPKSDSDDSDSESGSSVESFER